MTGDKRGMSLVDMVRELTQPHTHREHYTIRQRTGWEGHHHQVKAPALLDQLTASSPSGAGEERAGSGFTSRPAARLEALDTMINIDKEASAWVRDLGEDDPLDTKACILRLHGLSASTEPVTRKAIFRDVRRWWTQARIASGWDSAAWRPDNTCPMCGVHGGLRVRLADRVALCVDCRETWDETNIGLLADHIRIESEEGKPSAKGPREPCACPWPYLPLTGRWHLCPWCGSPRCVHAQENPGA